MRDYLEGVGVDVWMGWYLDGFLLEYESRPHCHPHIEVKISKFENSKVRKISSSRTEFSISTLMASSYPLDAR